MLGALRGVLNIPRNGYDLAININIKSSICLILYDATLAIRRHPLRVVIPRLPRHAAQVVGEQHHVELRVRIVPASGARLSVEETVAGNAEIVEDDAGDFLGVVLQVELDRIGAFRSATHPSIHIGFHCQVRQRTGAVLFFVQIAQLTVSRLARYSRPTLCRFLCFPQRDITTLVLSIDKKVKTVLALFNPDFII